MNRATTQLPETQQSVVAHLLAQIDRERQMMVWAQKELSIEKGKLIYIRRRKEAIGQYRQQLVGLVGERQAASLMRTVPLAEVR